MHHTTPRSLVEILLKSLLINALAIANYIHFKKTLHEPYSISRRHFILKTIIFFLMPTLVIAEIILTASRTALLLLARNDDKPELTLDKQLRHWRKLVCGTVGMYTSPKAGEEQEIEAASTNDSPRDDEVVQLVQVEDPDDVRYERQPWNIPTIARIALVFVLMLQAIGTCILWVHRNNGYGGSMSIDKRNFVAAFGSLVCSVSTIAVLSLRSEWTLHHLTSSPINRTDHTSRWSVVTLVIAAILNEAPFLGFYDYYTAPSPVSFAQWLSDIFQGSLLTFAIIAILVILIVSYRDSIADRVKIRWSFVFWLFASWFLIWIALDLIFFVVRDVEDLSSSSDWEWWRDPWATYLPIC